ncbi:MAG: carboxypeptidase regulatory-like domain-containing protein [Acidobacteria bacterium]|nr:carboxypeptidase regulatory-like domain-containing protein [Acidobacteriota bacterium]
MQKYLATALVLLIGAATAFAGDTTRLQITVTNLNGKPVDRASVIVRFVKGRSISKLGKKQITSWETRTNQDGFTKVPEMPQGTVLIQVIAKGYQTYGQQFEIEDDDKSIQIKLNPPQPQHSSHQ